MTIVSGWWLMVNVLLISYWVLPKTEVDVPDFFLPGCSSFWQAERQILDPWGKAGHIGRMPGWCWLSLLALPPIKNSKYNRINLQLQWLDLVNFQVKHFDTTEANIISPTEPSMFRGHWHNPGTLKVKTQFHSFTWCINEHHVSPPSSHSSPFVALRGSSRSLQ